MNKKDFSANNKIETIDLKDKNKIITSKDDLRDYEVLCSDENFSIDYFIKSDKFVIHPIFQRHFVWNSQQKSQLIETILTGLIMPVIYVYQEVDSNKLLVIDGQQRLTTIKKFINNEFKLTGLQKNFLNGFYYYDLPDKYKNRINNYTIRTVKIFNVNSNEVLFSLFKRFNTGATRLNSQELRNCVYSGKFNSLIKTLSTYPPFISLFKEKEIDRMQKEECVLRFCAFYENFDLYKADTNKFLDNYFEEKLEMNHLSNEIFEIKTNDLVSKFKKSIDLSIAVFGQNAFKCCTTGNKNNKINYKTFSKSVYDLQMLGFANQEAELIIRYKDKIKQKYEELITTDPDFCPNYKKNSKKAVEYRINLWRKEISKIIQKP